MKDYDIIIVGAGIGGLVCGTLLSRKNLDVLIVEQSSKPGGYCSSFRREGFTFDACVHSINGCGKDGILSQILKELGIIEGEIEFLPLDPYDNLILPDFSISIPKGIETYKEKLSSLFFGQSKGITEYFKEATSIFQMFIENPFRGNANFDPRFALPYRRKSFKELLAKHIDDQRLMDIIGGQWGYVGLPPEYASAVYMSCVLMCYQIAGSFYPKGGVGVLPELIVQKFKQSGGDIRFDSLVKKILTKDNKACSIELSDGERIKADIIISNVDVKTTLLTLVGRENFKQKYIRRIEGMERTLSAFCVYLGVDIDLKELGFGEGNYWYYDSSDYDTETYISLVERGKMDKGGIFFSAPSLKDPDLAPQGKHILSILTLAPYHIDGDWDKIKYDTAGILIEKAEKLIPNLSQRIVVQEIATPRTLEKYTLNIEGAMYGLAQTPDQAMADRPKNKTPLEGLYLVGQDTLYGGAGIMGTALSGYYTAVSILDSLYQR